MDWTVKLIETFGSGYAEQKAWHKCSTCAIERTTARLAYDCWKSHRRSHERVYANLDTRTERHEVSFDGKQPLCGNCTRVSEGVLQTVHMIDPPNCSRCSKPIRNKFKEELIPPPRPNSEMHREEMLRPTRAALVEIERFRVHKKLKGLQFPSGHADVDARNFKDFGPPASGGNGAIPRSIDGYSTIKKSEPLQCKSFNLETGTYES